MRSLRQKLADLPPAPAERRAPARATTGASPPPGHSASAGATRPPASSPLDPPAPGGGSPSPASPPEASAASNGEPPPPPAGRFPWKKERGPAASASSAPKPTLDELRARIAALVGHQEPARPRPDPSAGELPFFVEHTPFGPRYVRRVRAAPAARVGRAPLVSARDADAATLGLLALDPTVGACDPRKALYLDTETTGLAGGTGTVAFLVGLAFFDEDHGTFVLEQMLLRRLGEEAPILDLLHRRLAGASMVVTYNGKSFDVPLLRTRYVMNRLSKPAEPPHLDLLHVARRVHKHRLATCSLASIESHVLGRERMGDVAGADIVEAYAHFLRTGDEGSLHGVVTHNEHDVFAMVALLGLYGEPFGVTTQSAAESENDAASTSGDPLERDGAANVEGVARASTSGGAARTSGGAANVDAEGGASRTSSSEVNVDAEDGSCAGPGGGLGAADLAGIARTLHRAGAVDRAHALAGEAIRAGGGPVARRVSADILRARGEIAAALRQYEAILAEVDDPEVRLVLAKLYEHKGRAVAESRSVAYERALAMLAAGTTEGEEATRRRRARLEKKLVSASALAAPRAAGQLARPPGPGDIKPPDPRDIQAFGGSGAGQPAPRAVRPSGPRDIKPSGPQDVEQPARGDAGQSARRDVLRARAKKSPGDVVGPFSRGGT